MRNIKTFQFVLYCDIIILYIQEPFVVNYYFYNTIPSHEAFKLIYLHSVQSFIMYIPSIFKIGY